MKFSNIKEKNELDKKILFKGSLDEAEEGFKKETKKAKYLGTLSELYYSKGMLDDALKEIRKAIEIEPGSGHLREQLKKIEAVKDKRLSGCGRKDQAGFQGGVLLNPYPGNLFLISSSWFEGERLCSDSV